MTPFDTLWAGDLLDQVGVGPGDRLLDLAAPALFLSYDLPLPASAFHPR